MQMPDLQYVPQEIQSQLSNMKPFILLIQKKGPHYDAADAQRIIQAEHLPHLFKLRAEGIVALSMPIMDHTDLTALAVYTLTDKSEVKRITDGDPAVKKGVFTYQLYDCMGMKADTLK